MQISISKKCLIELVIRQLNSLFGFDKEKEWNDLTNSIEKSLKKIEHCFSFNIVKYYRKDNNTYFNPFHSGQYTIFLYFLSRILSEVNSLLADKVYYLNKVMNCVDLYYEVVLPDIFGLDHPLGSVIGRAKFSDFFHFSQNCRVGNNHGKYPAFEENVIMLADSTVIGESHIGSKCIISAKTYIKDTSIPDNSLVFGASPNLTIKKIDEAYFHKYSNFDNKKR